MLTDKVAVVTGGTRGIGFATVKKFLENNCKVVLFGSRQETAEKALKELLDENPEYPVEAFWPNLANYEDIKKTFNKIVKDYGKIDILVNNAGVSDATSLYDYSVEKFDKIMDLNINAVFRCSKAAAPIMKKQGGGVILSTSSMVSITGQPSGVAYPTSKFAVNGLTISLARELGPDNIRVNAVAPGVTDTDMVESLPENLREGIISQIPLKRVGEPEDIANAFLFLASDMASYVSGEILSVDGACRS